MIKIIFVCFGNICRSPMAEFVMKDLVDKAGMSDKILVESAGCFPNVGTPMSNGTREQLELHKIPFNRKKSVQLVKTDYETYDYIIGMDRDNVDDIKYIFDIPDYDPKDKVWLLLDFANEHRDVDDPYYTGDFATTYVDVLKGCKAFLSKLSSNNYEERFH